MESMLFTVSINVNGKKETIKMEHGCTFTNNGGTYAVSKDGILKFKKNGSDVWSNANHVNMTNYQWHAFQNISNNDGQVGTYTQQDIKKAMEFYRDGKFVKDMSVDLPQGYKIEKPKLSSAEQYVQMDVNYKGSKNATLKFQIQNVDTGKNSSGKMKPISFTDPSAEVEEIKFYDELLEYETTGAYTVSKGNITSFYDYEKKLVGTIETGDFGSKHYNADGDLQFITKLKRIRKETRHDNGEDHFYIYDNKGSLKYIWKYDYNIPYIASGAMTGIPVEEYKNGKLIRTTTGSLMPYTDQYQSDYYEVEPKGSSKYFPNSARYGMYCID